MAEFPALPIWTDALIADTTHLSPAEFGAYVRLLIAAWRLPGCCLPNDDQKLGQLSGDPRHWSRIRTRVMEFWRLNDDGQFYQKRLLREYEFVIEKTRKLSELNSAKAGRRWHPLQPSSPNSGARFGPSGKQKLSRLNGKKVAVSLKANDAAALPQESPGKEPTPTPIYKDAGREERKWVSITQPEWKIGVARWRKEKGCNPPMDADGGWWFPPDWLEGARP